MTTIICDGNVMVADGQSTYGSMVSTHHKQKIHRVILPMGDCYVGFCGRTDHIRLVLKLLAADPQADKLDLPDDCEVLGLVVTAYGKMYFLEITQGHVIYTPRSPEDRFVCIGSGEAYAYGAMEAKHDPMLAITIASNYDIGTGGAVSQVCVGDLIKD